MEEIHKRLNDNIKSRQEFLEKNCHRECCICGIECCDNATSKKDFESCRNTCHVRERDTLKYVRTQFWNDKTRIRRCAHMCEERFRDKMSDNVTEAEELALDQELEMCVGKCADAHIKILPKLTERRNASLYYLWNNM